MQTPLQYQTVSYKEESSHYPILEIRREECVAEVALHGGHVISWQPKGQEPIIYTSPEALYQEGKAIRGGIPICWPWFNAHPSDPTLPSHGIARNRFWELVEVAESPSTTKIKLRLNRTDETRAIWDQKFSLIVTISLGTTLEVSLKTTNEGSESFTVGGALHTYLNVSNISNISIEGLDRVQYLNTVGTEALEQQNGAIKIHEETDRIYLNTTQDILLNDEKRTLKVSRSGSNSAVVWNPWSEKAKALKDLPNEDYKNFVCIEAANAKEDVYSLQQGESHTLATSISIL